MEYDVASKSLGSWNAHSRESEAKSAESSNDECDRGNHFHFECFCSENLSDCNCVEFCEEVFLEPTIFNLGQSYRKARRFEDASICFGKCLALCPVRAKLRWYILKRSIPNLSFHHIVFFCPLFRTLL